jgi:hypothetical protein
MATKEGTTKSKQSKLPEKPQDKLDDFWNSYICKRPGKVSRIFPKECYVHLILHQAAGAAHNSTASYEEAVEKCKKKVARIVQQCHSSNQKYTDIEFDLKG